MIESSSLQDLGKQGIGKVIFHTHLQNLKGALSKIKGH